MDRTMARLLPRLPKPKPAAQLSFLPDDGPTPERARALVAKVPDGADLRKEWVRCPHACCKNRPTHGPYWYAYFFNPETRRRRKVYIGNEGKLYELLASWRFMRAERAAAGEPVQQGSRRRRRRRSSHESIEQKTTARRATSGPRSAQRKVPDAHSVEGSKALTRRSGT